ncbi:rod shape-determining protein RodA [Candidatus Magnetominusculus dajiuhuensis]|uniref:rod shape-determining protein RodA n=1 Tax=Candidatus Magnetominusculus dajiuhuensis TaxID=3137712 RepID=UPI003B436730
MWFLQINRKYLKQFDWYMLSLLLAISIIGVMTIYSATRPVITTVQPNYYIKQMVWMLMGLVALLVAAVYDYSWLRNSAYFLYSMGLVMLVLVLFAGRRGMGAQRWLELGPVSFQPSELFRILLIIGISKYLSTIKGTLTKWPFFISLTLFGLLPFVLILKQPHLGTGLVLLATFFFLVIAKKIEKKILVTLILVTLVVPTVAGKLVWRHLKDYQKNRILAFIEPEADPKGIGYQIEQSKITIGSGQVLGRGYLKGTQGPLRFLPEKHTDFIYCVFAEEWGFVGSSAIVALYLLLFLRGISTAVKSKDEFGRYLALGLTFMLFLYFFINMGMVLGMMPVVGVPIPFMSYGGTTLITNYIAIGILINIRMRRSALCY